MKKTISVLFLAVSLLWAAPLYAEKVTLVYTGQVFAMLYPCHCPKAPYGGLARRATLLKKLRSENANMVVVDSGNFFGGGAADVYKVNGDLDKTRSELTAKAMELMGYDAAAVGSDELNFGKEFLGETIKNTALNITACNVPIDGVVPFVIKKVGTVQVGIVSVLPQLQPLAGTIAIAEPVQALKNIIKQLRDKKVSVIILLSQLGAKEDERLVKEGLGVDIIISGVTPAANELYTKVGSTLMLRPAYEGRYLRRVQFEVAKGTMGAATVAVDELGLSSAIADDAEIASLIPKCFSQHDCFQPGMVGSCDAAGTSEARCSFREYALVSVTVIEPVSCYTCAGKRGTQILQGYLPGLRSSYIKEDTKEAQDLIKRFNIVMLPAYILDKKAVSEPGFVVLLKEKLVQPQGDGYLVNPSLVGVSYFTGRKRIQDKVDIFVDLGTPASRKALPTIRKLVEELASSINVGIHFTVFEKSDGTFSAQGGASFVEEYKRCVCVMKYTSGNWWDYLMRRQENINSLTWEECLIKNEKNKKKIQKCLQSDEASTLLRRLIVLPRELKIAYGPLILVDNQEVFGVTDTTPVDEIKNIIDAINKGAKK